MAFFRSLLLTGVLCVFPVWGEVAPDTSFQRFGGVPVAAFSEATGWQLGALGMVFFRSIGPQDPGSQVDVAVVRSTRGQTRFVVNPDIAFRKGLVRWESQYQYKDWPGNYWAGGNDPTDSSLAYDMKLWNTNGTVTWSWSPRLHLGFQYELESNQAHFYKADSADRLANPGAYPTRAPAYQGGTRAAWGYTLAWDSRDHDNWPRHGLFSELRQLFYSEYWGSSWNFVDTKLDTRFFLPAPFGSAWGFGAYWNAVSGTAPFDRMSMPDGVYHLRGLEAGRLQDRQQLVLQTECRVPLFWRFGGTAFAEAGKVGPNLGSLFRNSFHYSFGLGGRLALNRSRRLNARGDLAWVDGGIGMAVYLREAF